MAVSRPQRNTPRPTHSALYLWQTVAAAEDTRTKEKYALKRIANIYQNDPTAAKRTLRCGPLAVAVAGTPCAVLRRWFCVSLGREILLLRALDHPNIISIFEMWEHKDDIYLAEPLMEADLHRIVRSSQADPPPPNNPTPLSR